jgi:hypothetical protein
VADRVSNLRFADAGFAGGLFRHCHIL